MIDVSIIVPVWNAAGLLPRCLDSIVAQTWDHDRIEVLLVDDGSTDGSGEICDDYALRHSMFRVLHQENSGGPAAPRNRGIEVARGEFLFFCDNDDYFGPEAVQRMVAHAHAWGSDVLLLKMGQSGGRDIPRRVFEEEQPKADLFRSAVTSTLGPWKLYRRSLILENGIRFPEDCSFDDSVFTLHAMLLASTISVANDYEYYYWVLRSDGGNISTGDISSAWHRMDRRIRGLERLVGLVDEYADPELAQHNMLPKLIREPLTATVRRLPNYPAEQADGWARSLRDIVRPHYSPVVADQLRFDIQLMYAVLLQTEDSEGLLNMIRTMPGVPANTRFVEEGGRLFAEHLTHAERPVLVRLEIGPKTLQAIMTSRNTLVAADWDGGSLALAGELTLVSGGSMSDAALEIRIKDHIQPDRSHTIPVDVAHSSERAVDTGAVTATVIDWSCVIERDLLAALPFATGESFASDISHRWDVELIVRARGEVLSVRLGADRKPGVFQTFASGAAVTPSGLFIPDETGMKNISLWELGPDSDLSPFRVKRGRPPANVELLTQLARHDYAAAHAVAEAIQTGRFNPDAGRLPRIGRTLVRRARSLARRVLGLARKALGPRR